VPKIPMEKLEQNSKHSINPKEGKKWEEKRQKLDKDPQCYS
jgi:hypothetical protein